jgi:hypothetical protein
MDKACHLFEVSGAVIQPHEIVRLHLIWHWFSVCRKVNVRQKCKTEWSIFSSWRLCLPMSDIFWMFAYSESSKPKETRTRTYKKLFGFRTHGKWQSLQHLQLTKNLWISLILFAKGFLNRDEPLHCYLPESISFARIIQEILRELSILSCF